MSGEISSKDVAAGADLGLSAAPEPAFREQDFGDWTGRRHDELAVDFGQQYEAFWRAPASSSPPGGESFESQIARVAAGLQRLDEGDICLIVHSGTIRAVLSLALKIAPMNALSFVLDPLSITRLDRLEGGWRIVGVNVSS